MKTIDPKFDVNVWKNKKVSGRTIRDDQVDLETNNNSKHRWIKAYTVN